MTNSAASLTAFMNTIRKLGVDLGRASTPRKNPNVFTIEPDRGAKDRATDAASPHARLVTHGAGDG